MKITNSSYGFASSNSILMSYSSTPVVDSTSLDDSLMFINNKSITHEELLALRKLNEEFSHTIVGSTNVIVSIRDDALGEKSHHIEPFSEFKKRFLHEDSIASLNRGDAWLRWKGKNYFEDGVVFCPDTRGLSDKQFNLWTGFSVEKKFGEVTPYLDLVRSVICNGDTEASDYLIKFLAHMIQFPSEKPTVAILMKSIQGIGKGSFVAPLLSILGMHGVHVNGSGLITGRFNSCIANKLLVFADETNLTDSKTVNIMKGLISERTLWIEKKGIEPLPICNYIRFFIACNSESALLAGIRERRYLLLEPSLKTEDSKKYFDAYRSWLERGGSQFLLNYLQELDISDFDPRRAPMTSVLKEEILENLGLADDFMLNELLKPSPFKDKSTIFPDEVLNSFENYVERLAPSMTRARARSLVGKMFKKLSISKKGRSGRGLYYELPEVGILKERFAKHIGFDVADIFD